MSEQDLQAAESNHSDEGLDLVLPANHQPTKVMQPSKQSLYSPTLAIAPQRTTVLRPLPALSPVGCNHCNRSLLFAFLELFSSRRGLDRKLATSHRFAREGICRSSPDQLLELIEGVRALPAPRHPSFVVAAHR